MSEPLLLDVQGVSKYFDGLKANDDISFQVKRGEIVSIIGPNGAGKSTLFGCVTGFHPVDKGRLLFKGRDITNRKPHTIARLGIVRTFQIVQVISDMTVLENVMTGGFLRRTRVGDVRRKAEEILAFTGLMEAVMELSDRVIVLNSGRKIMEGTPKEVVENPEVKRAYLGERYSAVRQ